MITPATIYWISQFDRIIDICTVAMVVGLIICTFMFVAVFTSAVSTDPNDKKMTAGIRKWLARISFLVVMAGAGIAFLPTSKSAAAMVVIPIIANSERVQNISEGIVSLAEDWLKELAPKKEGETK